MTNNRSIIEKYIPAQAVDTVLGWFSTYRFQLSIRKNRNTKLGDYKAPVMKSFHRISINRNLNPYSFLITLTHEIAHLIVWEQYRNKVKPHGKEWKDAFRRLMKEIDQSSFPKDINEALQLYMRNPAASSGSHLQLSRALNAYDSSGEADIYLENLPSNIAFMTPNGRSFKIKEKLRKRYKCICLNNNRLYLIHPLVKVIPVDSHSDI